ncbi:phage tail sheath family protein [Algoriphagus machipongonensis]|uniref:Phage tail sheath protein FI n=1 Tax=Algoriphagus machipongonensis TaxID=388413 RepID=A3I2L1_9BACT|nr:phage tail sheath C-terminal domain-containing protein [Algoriphagus machipongonensis]EAZ79315.1 putative phage tail sheath protein FI [Algoriphagus machipongonensis]
MSDKNIKMPGVYIEEKNAFPNSVVGVATAIPAFIGYTPQANLNGKSCINKPVKISSFNEFKSIFCFPNEPNSSNPKQQYTPSYYLVKQEKEPENTPWLTIRGSYYAIVPDPSTVYYLYSSILLFFQNGGSDAYIVSVGTYGSPSNAAQKIGEDLINPNIRLNDLVKGLQLLKNEPEPTLYVCPEATLLSKAEFGKLTQMMLQQNEEMGTAISILDVPCGKNPDPITFNEGIESFRRSIGSKSLSYGAAYYPFVETTIMQDRDIDFTILFGGDISKLQEIINPKDHPDKNVSDLFKQIEDKPSKFTEKQIHKSLYMLSKAYKEIISKVLKEANTLPPSAGIAGVITMTDNSFGVWKAPANQSLMGVINLPIRLTDSQQENFNIDPATGKSINAIRVFNGQGILIWGARTLDGNSLDYRYISVKRTLIFIEQSCKAALKAYVFEPNDKNTWSTVTKLISNFLTSIWKQGGLAGANSKDSFSVACGIGTTMTENDILEGVLRLSIKVALTHPAEFIDISLEQKMAKA